LHALRLVCRREIAPVLGQLFARGLLGIQVIWKSCSAVPLPSRLTIASAAMWQVCSMSTVGTCAWAFCTAPSTVTAITLVIAGALKILGKIAARPAVSTVSILRAARLRREA